MFISEIQLSEGQVWDLNNQCWCLSQTRSYIYNVLCRGIQCWCLSQARSYIYNVIFTFWWRLWYCWPSLFSVKYFWIYSSGISSSEQYLCYFYLFIHLLSNTIRARPANTSEYLNSPPVYNGFRVTRSLVLYVRFVDRCLSFCLFCFGHFVVCPRSIYDFWLPLWYLQPFLKRNVQSDYRTSNHFYQVLSDLLKVQILNWWTKPVISYRINILYNFKSSIR